jgi:hypothetical protein
VRFTRDRRRQFSRFGCAFARAFGRAVARFARGFMASFGCAQDRLAEAVPFRFGVGEGIRGGEPTSQRRDVGHPSLWRWSDVGHPPRYGPVSSYLRTIIGVALALRFAPLATIRDTT